MSRSLSTGRETVNYELTPALSGEPRLMRVTMRFPVPEGQSKVTLQMPVWSPGDYHIQNHAQYVRDLHAFAGKPEEAKPLAVMRSDANNWEIEAGENETVTVTYAVPQTPPGFFSQNVQLEKTYAFCNGPAVYLYLAGHKDAPVSVTLHPPKNWQAEVPLSLSADADESGAAYSAPDYDTLADSPVIFAAPDAIAIRAFKVGKTSFRAVFFGKDPNARNIDSFPGVLQKLAQAEIKIMGEMPAKHYDFLFDVNGQGGGLEHLNCCRIGLYSGTDPRRAVGMFSHEMFHLWNIKRIRPRVLGPFDYIRPPQTRNLWFAEGVTDYYATVAARRAGLTTPSGFLQHWRGSIHGLQGNPARLKVTADECSFRVWEANNSDGYGGLSYYLKGSLIGLCLDLKLRHITNNRRSLDDVMRTLMKRSAPPRPGYGEDEIREVVNEVAGQDLSAFYDLLARSTQEMPFAECLGYAGLDADLNPLPDATLAQRALRDRWMAEENE